MSAIPWVGQDIVESNIFIENLFNNNIILAIGLPLIGIISTRVHINRKERLSYKEYLSIPTSFLAFFVGLVDGDGYIQITRTTKGFIAIKLAISLHLDDLSVLNYIQSVLKVGKINTYGPYHNHSPICKLIINKTELQEIIFPLLLHHNIFFLTTTRRDQYNKAMCIMANEIKLFSDIPELASVEPSQAPGINVLPNNAEGYLNLFFFKNWLVGFTNAEGSFFIKNNQEGCFQLKQRLHINLFEAIKLLFNTSRKITIDRGLYIQYGVSSIKDIQNVINFFSFSGYHPLIGLKCIQYSNWLTDLRNSDRYKGLILPN